MKDHSMFNGAYGLSVIGAAFYFIQNSTGFWGGVLGLLKGLVWPALAAYQLMDLLNL